MVLDRKIYKNRNENRNEITYIKHSSFCVELDKTLFYF